MCAQDDPLLALSLPCEITALASVHDPLARMTLPADPQERADLQLVVWELLTNAVIHSGGAPEETVELEINDHGSMLHVSVSDPGAGFEPQVKRPDSLRPNGRGLLIVDTLAARWGVEQERCSRVWCEMPLARAA